MTVKSDSLTVSTKGHSDVVDITKQVQHAVTQSGLRNGVITVFVTGSTAGVTTIEYEPGLIKDIKKTLEEIAPAGQPYHHHDTWGDDNGHSHIRASLLGPSLSVPFCDGKLMLGTWQQVVVIDCDTRPRERHLHLQAIGES
ncbi:MAG: secondary thiamine-phosphate synthase enzyme YjbQ [Myxococcales bacterium]|jgi:secondary thiamine-phosphate synthase enzyme